MLLSEKVLQNRTEFLGSLRLGVDFGEKAHGIALVRGQDVALGVTLRDASESDLSKRNQLRRGRRTRESRRQRLARLRQWCLRNHLPDPDPYFNGEIAEILWPPDRDGKPRSDFRSLTPDQRTACRKGLLSQPLWQEFLSLPPEVIKQCALVNPFIARRLAREGKATPLIFVRALWHLFEHRGFDWYNRVREQDDDFLADKGALLRHLKTLVISSDEELEQWKADVRKRDEEATEQSKQAKPWLTDLKVEEELKRARGRGKDYPIKRRLNPPRHYVAQEVEACLASLPSRVQPKNAETRKKLGDWINFPLSRAQALHALVGDRDKNDKFTCKSGLLNWNRREPRFDNRQLRGCTWCAALGIQRNTPRNKNVLEQHIKGAIRDIKVAAGEVARTAEAEANKRGKVTRASKQAISAATRWLNEEEFNRLWELVTDVSIGRDQLKERLTEFFKSYAKLPKQAFVKEGQRVRKQPKLTDPYQWHREELLNLAEGWRRDQTGDKQYREAKGRSRLCVHCLEYKMNTPPDQRQPPVGEADVILVQRALKARCDRLISWLRRNAPPDKYPVKYIRIEAVLPRPEEKARMKAEARELDADQSPKAKLKFRLMEEVGAHCVNCGRPYLERERRGPKSKRDDQYCQCPRPDLHGLCPYCWTSFPARELQIEHIYPRNPSTTAGGIGPDIQPNKTVACDRCNQGEKKNRLPFDYFQNVVGGDSWQRWQSRVRSFNWPKAKKEIALLSEYKLPEDLGDVALAHTGLVHRYLRQQLAKLYFPKEVADLRNPKIDRRTKETCIKPKLDWQISTPAGWLTSRCRLDWEHEKQNGQIFPLVPRKSPLRSPEQRQKDLQKRLSEIDERLPEAAKAKRCADIREGFARRAPVEDALKRVEEIAVCDRTNLNHHWIDAAVLASLPPQANQPARMGGLWVWQDKEVRADISFAPRAADYLKKFGDGSAIVDLQNRSPRFTSQQQETSLYGKFKPLDRLKPDLEPRPKKLPNKLLEEAARLPNNIFWLQDRSLSLRTGLPLSHEQRKAVLAGISNKDLQKKVARLFEESYDLVECHVIYEPVENLKVRDKDLIVSGYWRKVFARLCEAEYEFPKKRSEAAEAENAETDEAKTERRKPKDDEFLPAAAWENWTATETARLKEQLEERGKADVIEDVRPPRHLRIYFKLGSNERVVLQPTPKRAQTKRGITKPERICRMTSVGSHAVFDTRSGRLSVLLNPWKAHVEQTGSEDAKGLRIYKGDCIWLAERKGSGPGWYQVTEMSPAKVRLGRHDPEKAKLKVVPAWRDLNQLVQDAKAKEPNEEKRKKIKRDSWESDIDAADLSTLAAANNLKIKRKTEILIGTLA